MVEKMQLNHVIHINIKKNGTDGHFMPPDTVLRTQHPFCSLVKTAEPESLVIKHWTNPYQAMFYKITALYSVMKDKD